METNCLVETVLRGCKTSIWFEGKLYNLDGCEAKDNYEQVHKLRQALAIAGVLQTPNSAKSIPNVGGAVLA